MPKALVEPFTPVIKSTLEEVVNRLPEDFVMKGQAVPNHLKKVSPVLTGKGLKQERAVFEFKSVRAGSSRS